MNVKKIKMRKKQVCLFLMIFSLIFQSSVVFGQSSDILTENSCSGMEFSMGSQKLSVIGHRRSQDPIF